MINQIRICNNLLLVREYTNRIMGTMKQKDSVPNHIIDISTGNEMMIMDILK